VYCLQNLGDAFRGGGGGGGGKDSEDITVGAKSIFSCRRKVSDFNLLYLF
jgi:hypothetical protein